MSEHWRVIWAVWLIAAAVSFGILEALSAREDSTLSAVTRGWLGVDPPAPRRRVAVAVFVNALTAFFAWLVPHITDMEI